MSFALTTAQILNRTKSVTRRTGWLHLRAGDHVRAVRKGRGLRKGEQIERLAILRIVDVRRESLSAMIEDLQYGRSECRLEGFDSDDESQRPKAFVEWFADTHRCTIGDVVTRIEFAYE